MTGPYIVTTKRDATDGVRPLGLRVLSTVAVATLEAEWHRRWPLDRRPIAIQRELDKLPEVGTITLPDGTAIEVKPTTWVRLVMDIRAVYRDPHVDLRAVEASQGDVEAQQRILDAWNAKETP